MLLEAGSDRRKDVLKVNIRNTTPYIRGMQKDTFVCAGGDLDFLIHKICSLRVPACYDTSPLEIQWTAEGSNSSCVVQ
jgi:hypothetical protein